MTQSSMERTAPTGPAPVTNLAPGSQPRRITLRRLLLLLGPIVLAAVAVS